MVQYPNRLKTDKSARIRRVCASRLRWSHKEIARPIRKSNTNQWFSFIAALQSLTRARDERILCRCDCADLPPPDTRCRYEATCRTFCPTHRGEVSGQAGCERHARLARDTIRVRTSFLLHGATKPVTIDRFPAREMDEYYKLAVRFVALLRQSSRNDSRC